MTLSGLKTERPTDPSDRYHELPSANRFRTAEFLNALRTSSLPLPVRYTGLVKADDQDPEALLFSMNSCRRWVRLDQGAIERIEYLGSKTCENHEYAVVTLEIKQPTTPEGLAIARLADHARSSALRAGAIETQEEYGAGCAMCIHSCARISNPALRNACFMACVEGPCAE